MAEWRHYGIAGFARNLKEDIETLTVAYLNGLEACVQELQVKVGLYEKALWLIAATDGPSSSIQGDAEVRRRMAAICHRALEDA